MKTTHLTLTLSLLLAGSASGFDMIGVDFNGGIHRIDSTDGSNFLLASTGISQANGLAVNNLGEIYVAASSGGIYRIDEATGAATFVHNVGLDIRAVAVTGTKDFYFSVGTLGSDDLYHFHLGNLTVNYVGSLGTDGVQSMAFDGNGTLYAWSNQTGFPSGQGLVTVDVTTGAITDVNTTFVPCSGLQYIAFSPSGALFGGATDHFSINPNNGTKTLVTAAAYANMRGADFTGTGVPCVAQWGLYGAGVNGTLGKPKIGLGALPVLGTTVKLGVISSSPQPETAVLFFGLDNVVLAAPWGGALLVDPLVVLSTVVPPTGFGLDLPIPNDTVLCGLETFFQFVQVDAGAPLGVSASRGLGMRIGL